jgi:hypothetical protein
VADTSLETERAAIAQALREYEQQQAAASTAGAEAKIAAQPLDPRSFRQNEPGDTGPALKPPVEKAYRPEGNLWGGGLPVPKESGLRDVLDVASGGGTERVASAVAGAPGRAASEVEARRLETMSPDTYAELVRTANPEQLQALQQFIRVAPQWQPGTRTNAQGSTGKDPAAVRAAFDLQGQAERRDASALNQTQAADREQYGLLQKVQQNEMRAVQEFKRESDALHDRYDQEREQQLGEMQAVQRAMQNVPDAPRTLRQWVSNSGLGDKMALGLAGAFSVLGGAVRRDGGAGVQQLLKTIQGNIDANVKKEMDERASLGTRLGAANTIYASLERELGSREKAANITKALYYDAAANAVQQIATQYKLDVQSPQIQQLLSHLTRERQKLVLDTAATMQDQFSQTDKYNPGGLVAVSGGAAANANKYKSTDLEKDTQEFGKELEKRGFNMGSRAIGLYQKAIDSMKEAGFKNNENFKRAFVAIFDPQGNPVKQAAVLASLEPKERSALQYIVEANKEQLKDASGKSVTASEMVRDVIAKGGYSIDALDQARQTLAAGREQIYNDVAAAYDPRIPQTYDARKQLQGLERKHPGIGTGPRSAVDPSDLANRVEGRLRQ